ncbi:IclR family transcriptional regulator [Brevibacillus migulae]|uniref:IclR family transcriptional regulator n=1 Tax=Brevibacillus migulae TaxID=1644114 RepID=UPI00106E9F0A|nr:IclR family transcriptional regulator [Brevibacillus migulae]
MDHFLSSVRNSCTLLKLFLDSPKEMGVTELSKKLSLSKGAVHKILSTLEAEGFIRQNPKTKQYTLGFTLLELGSKVISNHDIVDFSQPFLSQLAKSTNELAVLCVLDKTDALYVSKVDSIHPIRFNVEIYRRFPPYSTSGSRVLLAYQSQEYQDQILQDAELISYTSQSFTSIEEIKQNLLEIRRQGYEISSNRRNLGVTGFAAPVFDASGEVTAAVSVIGPTDRIAPQQSAVLEQLLATTQTMSAQLGYRA